jgi:hypothetical protein
MNSSQPSPDSQGRIDPLVPVRHYYHVFAAGHWQAPVEEHFAALEQAALCDITVLTVGLVGPVAARQEAKAVISDRQREWCCPPRLVRWVEADDGWEQLTLQAIHDDVQEAPDEFAVLYAHTKGAYANSPENANWRRALTACLVPAWQQCVELLADHDIVGPTWMSQYGNWFFSGNFWWSKASYLRQLPPPQNESRYNAETWVSLGVSPLCPAYAQVQPPDRLPVPRVFDIASGRARLPHGREGRA